MKHFLATKECADFVRKKKTFIHRPTFRLMCHRIDANCGCCGCCGCCGICRKCGGTKSVAGGAPRRRTGRPPSRCAAIRTVNRSGPSRRWTWNYKKKRKLKIEFLFLEKLERPCFLHYPSQYTSLNCSSFYWKKLNLLDWTYIKISEEM